MDPASAIVGALVAGATVAAKDTATQAVKDAYGGLKRLVVDLYKFASISLLEKNPTNETFQAAVRDEVSASVGIENNLRVLNQVKLLNDALLANPKTQLEVWGVKIGMIKSGADVILERISGQHGGASVEQIEARGNVRIADVHGGPKQGK